MAVTTTTIGSISGTRIGWAANDLLIDIQSAIEGSITARGWELYDYTATNKIYRSLLDGGTIGVAAHYKYAELNYGTSGYLFLRLWELWDANTHTGTNMARTTLSGSGSTVAETSQQIVLNTEANGFIEIYALPRTLGIVAEYTGQRGPLVVLGERQRSNSLDTLTLGVPPTWWGNQINITTQNGANQAVTVPRTFSGDVAANNMFGYWYSPECHMASVNTRPNQSNVIDSKPYVGNMVLCTGYNPVRNVYGRLFNLKTMTAGAGIDGSFVDIPCDSNNFYAPSSLTTLRHRVFVRFGDGGILLLPVG